ncbi:hypothetical protein COLO4_05162 [Corchorus olitorius]|uniref:Uncharacterized protein n=1 Tax=Corchorus olitorius TaxID=93759 RepID=A0A1R3KRN6_9ROSI|nr:hypothetical protein COLO4_05162 [Corchorus olitorius]
MEVLPAGWLQTLGFCSVPFPRPNPRFNSRTSEMDMKRVISEGGQLFCERAFFGENLVQCIQSAMGIPG